MLNSGSGAMFSQDKRGQYEKEAAENRFFIFQLFYGRLDLLIIM